LVVPTTTSVPYKFVPLRLFLQIQQGLSYDYIEPGYKIKCSTSSRKDVLEEMLLSLLNIV
jgi:hypothetical protein